MTLTLVVLAAGKASRFGRLKQFEPVGPNGAALMDYAIHDAVKGGFAKIVLVVAPGLEAAFGEHIRQIFGGSIGVTLVSQALEAVPEDFTVPPERKKPWGTAHAVLAAAHELHGPFAVVNADDFYGAESYRMLRDQLLAEPETSVIVGFELRSTLSSHGGVSRGICDEDDAGFLTRLIEVSQIEEDDGSITGVDEGGRPIALTGGETASMNMWGLTPAVLETLRDQFLTFLETEGSDPTAEFLLSTAVGQQTSSGSARLRVLHSREQWFGMTFAADTPGVAARIAELVTSGEYPEHLLQEHT
jgi:hypothetical protein